MIEVSDVKKLGPKEGRRNMDNVSFHHLAVLYSSKIKTVLSLVSGENYFVIVDSPIWINFNLIYFNLIYLFVSRHEVHSMNTHTLQNAG